MAFVKIDCNMLTSTIWFDRPARELFLTALLMAEPFVADEPMAQLEVNSLQETGWQVPPGRYGFVHASGPGIVHASQVPRDEGMAALERLGAPEPESRSQEFDGRRMVRVNGGYLVLNYAKYRDKDATSTERSRRWRERKRAEEGRRPATRGRQGTSLGTQAEAEAEAEAEAPESLPNGSAPDRARTREAPSPPEKKTTEGAAPALRYKFDPNWKPKKAHLEYGQSIGLTRQEVVDCLNDARHKPIRQGFFDENDEFYRQLNWWKPKAEKERYRERVGKFEAPGAGRAR